jgi:hypothetical protein
VTIVRGEDNFTGSSFGGGLGREVFAVGGDLLHGLKGHIALLVLYGEEMEVVGHLADDSVVSSLGAWRLRVEDAVAKTTAGAGDLGRARDVELVIVGVMSSDKE